MDSFAASSESVSEPSPEAVEASQPFVGRWDRLVSRTNWEKGKIIAEWRAALVAAGAAAAEHADEAWSRLVGNVTPQHVGRLRRTFAKFHAQYESFDGLYWSHFFAALEWNDAELWLEGAVQNDWSVNEMRTARWQALGAVAAEQPQAADVVTSEADEDAAPIAGPSSDATAEVRDPREFGAEFDGPRHDGPDYGDEPDAPAMAAGDEANVPGSDIDAPFDFAPPQRPFENLAALPADLQEAFEAFKLAILHHKLSQWQEVASADVVSALRALEAMALAPA